MVTQTQAGFNYFASLHFSVDMYLNYQNWDSNLGHSWYMVAHTQAGFKYFASLHFPVNIDLNFQ